MMKNTPHPMAQVKDLYEQILLSNLPNKHCVAVAITSSRGLPDLRLEKIKRLDSKNLALTLESGLNIETGSSVALCLHWEPVRHQIRIRGIAQKNQADKGFTLVPDEIEFWVRKDFRIHDRTSYTLDEGQGTWTETKLFP